MSCDVVGNDCDVIYCPSPLAAQSEKPPEARGQDGDVASGRRGLREGQLVSGEVLCGQGEERAREIGRVRESECV